MNQTDPKHQCTFAIETNPSPEDIAVIDDGISEYNRSQGADDTYTKLEILLRDPQGKVVGGLLGGTIWGMLNIGILWIAEVYRKQGYGQEILKAAEQASFERGCHRAYVSTTSFQALEFYERCGYQNIGVMEDVPKDHNIYFLHKSLR